MKIKEGINTIKWLYDKTKGYRLKIIFFTAYSLVGAMLSLVFIMLNKTIIDGASSKNEKVFLTSAFFMLALTVIQTVCDFFVGLWSEKTSQNMILSLREKLLSHILKSDYFEISGFHSGDLIDRIYSDLQIISSGCLSMIPSVVFTIFRLAGATVFLAFISPEFAFLFITAWIILSIFITVIKKSLKKYHKTSREASGKAHTFMQETLSSILAAKAFSAEEKLKNRAMFYQKEHMKSVYKRYVYSSLMNTGFSFVMGAGYFVAMMFGCVGLFKGILTFGSLTAVLQLVSHIQSPIMSYSSMVSDFYAVAASTERIIELENISAENSERLNKDEMYKNLKEIVIEKLSFAYSDKNILEDVETTIKKGDMVSIEGESGCGKSTLFALILGLYKPGKGKILLNIKDKSIEIDAKYRKIFAYVPQENHLFLGSIKENLTMLDNSFSDEEIWEALRLSCADGFVNELSKGIDTVLNERGKGLSEGQMQRLAIARAILCGAPILLLDEATSALDEITEAKVLENIKNLKNRTCIVVAHGKSAINICSKHLVLKDNKIYEKISA